LLQDRNQDQRDPAARKRALAPSSLYLESLRRAPFPAQT
jgi:hypothetical protein